MKLIMGLIIIINSIGALAFDTPIVTGTVDMKSELNSKIIPGGVLFVFAKKNQLKGQPPVAVIKILNPKFPQKFSITKRDIIMTNSKLENSMYIMARYSPSGNPMPTPDSLEGSTSNQEPVRVGISNIKIHLDEKNTFNSRKEIKIPMH